MLVLKFGDIEVQVKNELNELTIKDFEKISSVINNKETGMFEKWSELFLYLGITQELIDEMDATEFIQVASEYNNIDTTSGEIVKSFKINDVEYVAFDEKFKMSVKEMTMIEAAIKKNPERYIGEVMAIIYKNTSLDKNLNYDKAHLHFKAELFRKELTFDKALPIVNYISQRVIKNVNNLNSQLVHGEN